MVEYIGSFLDTKNPLQLNLSKKSIQSHCFSINKVSFYIQNYVDCCVTVEFKHILTMLVS